MFPIPPKNKDFLNIYLAYKIVLCKYIRICQGIYHGTRTGFFIVTDTGGEKNKVHIQTEHLESISQFIIFIIIYHKR